MYTANGSLYCTKSNGKFLTEDSFETSGLYSNADLNIIDSTIVVKTGSADQFSCGIYLYGHTNIIKVFSDTSGNYKEEGGFYVNRTSINVKSNNANGCGIYCVRYNFSKELIVDNAIIENHEYDNNFYQENIDNPLYIGKDNNN